MLPKSFIFLKIFSSEFCVDNKISITLVNN